MSPKINGTPIPLWESIEVKKDQILEMAFATVGARSYIAFSGGINTTPWLGSRSTFHKAGSWWYKRKSYSRWTNYSFK